MTAKQVGHKEQDHQIASQFERVETIEGDNPACPGERLRFRHKTPSGDVYSIWYVGWNPKKPWRTAKVKKLTKGPLAGKNKHTVHASHVDLQAALEWLQALD